ncbi:hypothetical protein [Paenibacillus cremeus]|uniref:Chemotaxis protein n=1 Tax=Paenibacillus cremeus TaxID=2163881 RepID=A0A559KGK8_9BACL|nr:hypothetical protein [Paenibacillus cremeus]TVY11273.1 hypothetical protein FPZ49_03305 [Paenibacillus cremeus]
MRTQVGILIIHGMGKKRMGYSKPLQLRLRRRLAGMTGLDISVRDFVFEEVVWSDIVEVNQDFVRKAVKAEFDDELEFDMARSFIIKYAVDVLGYHRIDVGQTTNALHTAIHQRIAESLHQLRKKVGPEAPVCVIAHSLGTVVSSNYIYDMQMQKNVVPPLENNHLETCQTIASFYTLGSPISLFSLKYMNKDESTIQIPAKETNRYRYGEWVNLYYDRDIMAYPIAQFNNNANLNVKDIKLESNSGLRKMIYVICLILSLPFALLPLISNRIKQLFKVASRVLLFGLGVASHNRYFTDKAVIETITEGLIKVWQSVQYDKA